MAQQAGRIMCRLRPPPAWRPSAGTHAHPSVRHPLVGTREEPCVVQRDHLACPYSLPWSSCCPPFLGRSARPPAATRQPRPIDSSRGQVPVTLSASRSTISAVVHGHLACVPQTSRTSR